MYKPVLGIIGGGQLGSMLSQAAKKLDIRTVIYCDDPDAPGQHFADEFIFGRYDDYNKLREFCYKIDLITFEFENIPFETLENLNKEKKVIPYPKINKIVQNRLFEKDFINKCDLRTTKYVYIKNINVIIAGAGGSAHLPGMVASLTKIPVIGVPIESKKLKGLDSLLSIVQMPKGIPVATVAIGKDGAINAALLAASILSNSSLKIAKKLHDWRSKQTKSVKKKPY